MRINVDIEALYLSVMQGSFFLCSKAFQHEQKKNQNSRCAQGKNKPRQDLPPPLHLHIPQQKHRDRGARKVGEDAQPRHRKANNQRPAKIALLLRSVQVPVGLDRPANQQPAQDAHEAVAREHGDDDVECDFVRSPSCGDAHKSQRDGGLDECRGCEVEELPDEKILF